MSHTKSILQVLKKTTHIEHQGIQSRRVAIRGRPERAPPRFVAQATRGTFILIAMWSRSLFGRHFDFSTGKGFKRGGALCAPGCVLLGRQCDLRTRTGNPASPGQPGQPARALAVALQKRPVSLQAHSADYLTHDVPH